jgi:hypothetical protein
MAEGIKNGKCPTPVAAEAAAASSCLILMLPEGLGKLGNQFGNFGLSPRPHRTRAHVSLRAGCHDHLRHAVAVVRFGDHQNVEFARCEKYLLDLNPELFCPARVPPECAWAYP